VLLCVTRFAIALLPSSDESAMNSEGLVSAFRDIYCFSQHFEYWELTLERMYIRRASNLRWDTRNPAA
jgi:hypothetical protein